MKLPLDTLPATLRDVALAMKELNNVPVEATVPLTLALMGFAVQGRFDVDTHHFGVRTLSTYVLVIGESGALKSEIYKLLGRGVFAYEASRLPAYDNAMAVYAGDQHNWDLEMVEAKKEKDPRARKRMIYDLELRKPPRPKDYKVLFENPSSVGLIKLLERCEHSVGIMSPEAGSFLGGHALKSPEVRQKFVADMNKLWAGETVERLTGDEHQSLPNRRLSVLLMTQKETLNEFVNDPLIEGMGLTARILLSVTPHYDLPRRSVRDTEHRAVTDKAKSVFEKFGQRVQEHLNKGLVYDGAGLLMTTVVGMSDGALALYDEFQIGEGGDARANEHPFFMKYLEHTCRLAAIMATFDGHDRIEPQHMEAAIELMRYFGSQWLTLDTSTQITSREALVIEDIKKWMRKKRITSFVKTDLKNVHAFHRGLSGGEKVKLLDELVEREEEWLVEDFEMNGRDYRRYTLLAA